MSSRKGSVVRNRASAVLLGLVLLLSVEGCTVGIGIHLGRRPAAENRPPDIAHSRLVNNTLRLDLRRHPTRDDLGMNPTTTFASYGSTKHPVQVVLDLPGTTLTFPRTDITFATSEAGGASDPSPTMHQPRYFTLYVHYPDRATARADAVTRAPALGLTTDQVDAALADASGWHDEDGVPNGWLSARLGFNHGTDDSAYTAFYFFDLDVYHNPVVDTIKHGDTVVLDLRTSPSRADLGFFPDGYRIADIRPDPGHRLTVDIRSAGGTGRWRLSDGERLGSSSDTPQSRPTAAYLSTCDTAKRVRSDLLEMAGVFGLDRDDVRALPTSVSPSDSEPDSPSKVLIDGRTPSFRSHLKYEGPDESDRTACASVRLDF